MKRNIAGLILSGLMVVLFAGCGGAPFPETITLDGVTYTVIVEESDFDKMRTDPTGNYYLWRDIALTGDFDPIAPDTNANQFDFQGAPFTGIFEGNDKTISNLRIAKSSEDFVGLFGQIGADGVVRNLTLVLVTGDEDDPSVEGADYYVGALAGKSYGKIETVGVLGGFVTGTGSYVGGLVGRADSGSSITSSYATGTVSGDVAVGGLVGYIYSDSKITSSYATGTVSGTYNYIGGLVGYAYSGSSIKKSYATGSATGGVYVGGLVGYSNGDITSSYATGTVSGASPVGGLVGYSNGDITSSYFDTNSTSQTSGIGQDDTNQSGNVEGITPSSDISDGGREPFAGVGWDFDGDDAVWAAQDNGQWPLLAWQ